MEESKAFNVQVTTKKLYNRQIFSVRVSQISPLF